MKRTTLAITISAICSISAAHAQQSSETIEQISIIGSKEAINTKYLRLKHTVIGI